MKTYRILPLACTLVQDERPIMALYAVGQTPEPVMYSVTLNDTKKYAIAKTMVDFALRNQEFLEATIKGKQITSLKLDDLVIGEKK